LRWPFAVACETKSVGRQFASRKSESIQTACLNGPNLYWNALNAAGSDLRFDVFRVDDGDIRGAAAEPASDGNGVIADGLPIRSERTSTAQRGGI
jgi:hypothetical protein